MLLVEVYYLLLGLLLKYLDIDDFVLICSRPDFRNLFLINSLILGLRALFDWRLIQRIF